MNNAELLLKDISSLPKRDRLVWLKKQKQPQFLYKYHPFTNETFSEDIILRSSLYLNSADQFNDPFELQWQTTISDNLNDRISKFSSLAEQHPAKFPKDAYLKTLQILEGALKKESAKNTLDSLNKERQLRHGIASFASDPFNILMWSHYANQHQGCVLEFEVAEDVEIFGSTMSIYYSDNYPVVEWTNPNNTDLRSAILAKYSLWEYEQERRILKIDKAHTFLKYRPEALSSIYLGCKFNNENKKLLLEMMENRKNKSWRIPKLIQMEIDKTNYKLNPVLIG